MSRLVGAYVCPRGVAAIECRFSGKGLQVLRTFDHGARIESERQAADHLLRVLQDAGIRRARIVLTVRGFGLAHHMLALPPAPDALLAPIVDRELKRLEPQLDDPSVGWLSLPIDANAMTDAPPQRQVLAAALPRHVANALVQPIHAGGHRIIHVTALPAAVQRLYEEFVTDREPSAFVAPLRDGALLGFFLGGALRLVVEPPLGSEEYMDAASLAEEVELGAMFVRQQFRGAQIAKVVIAAPDGTYVGAETAFTERLGVPAARFALQHLPTGALAALGGVLDSRAATPLSLVPALGRGGSPAGRLRTASFAALALAAAIGTFAVFEAFRSREAATELQAARARIEQESFGMMSIRETADQRKLIRDAVAALRLAAADRAELQRALGAVGGTAMPPVRLDSIHLGRGTNGWISTVAGSVSGPSNARSVELLHEYYRDLPNRVPVEGLTLEGLTYADESPIADGPAGTVRFHLSFVLPYAKTP